MFRLWDRTTLCIFSNTSLALETLTILRIVLSSSLLYPNMSIMMLNCFTWYPGNCLFNSSRSGAYFSVFSQLLLSLLFSQGQLISSKVTYCYYYHLPQVSLWCSGESGGAQEWSVRWHPGIRCSDGVHRAADTSVAALPPHDKCRGTPPHGLRAG